MTSSAAFKTTDQSLFGSGGSLVSIDREDVFLGVQWDVSVSPENGLVLGDLDPGAFGGGVGLGGFTNGRIGLEYDLILDAGSIGATLPYDVTLDLPTVGQLEDSFNNSTAVRIGTSATFVGSSAKVATVSPTLQFGADLVFDVNAGITGKGVISAFGAREEGTFSLPIIDTPDSFELIAINRDNDGEVRLLDGLNVFQDFIDDTQSQAELIRDTARNVREASRPDRVSVSIGKPDVDISVGAVEDIVSAEVALPFIRLGDDVSVGPNSIKAEGSDTFASLNLDLDALVSTVVPQVPPLTLGVEADFGVGSANATATLIDVDFNPGLRLDQVAEIADAGVKLAFDFGRDVDVGVLNADGTVKVANAMRSTIEINAGEQLNLFFDGEDINLSPTYTIDADLSSRFGLTFESEIAFAALAAEFGIDLFGIDLAGGSLGPLFETSINPGDVDLGDLFNEEFNLGGFNTIDPGQFVITINQVDFTGTESGNWSNDANWSTGSTPIGNDVLITASNSPNKSVTLDVDGSVNNLFIAADAELSLFVDKTLTVEGNTLSNENQIELLPGSRLLFRRDTEPTIVGPGEIRLVDDTARISFLPPTPDANELNKSTLNTVEGRKITLVEGTIAGRGEVIGPGFDLVSGATISADFANNSLILEVEKQGGIESIGPIGGTLEARSGGTLDVRLRTDSLDPTGARLGNHSVNTDFNDAGTPVELTEGNDALMTVFAADNSVVRFQRHSDPGDAAVQARGIRFDSEGDGIIVFSNDTNFASVLNTGRLQIDGFADDNNSTWRDSVNDGTIFLAPSATTAASLTVAEFEGNGILFLDERFANAGNRATIGSGGPSPIRNESGHVIWGAGVIGLGEDVINRGSITGDGVRGVDLQVRNLKNEGGELAVVNSGLVRLTGNTANRHDGRSGTFNATLGGLIEVHDDSGGNQFDQLSDSGDLTLTGGSYRVDRRSEIRFVTNNAGDTFINQAAISLVGPNSMQPGETFTLGDGVTFGNASSGFKKLQEFDDFFNGQDGVLEVRLSYDFDASGIQNLGLILIDSATVGQISNRVGGEVQGSGRAEFQANAQGEVFNFGAIRAVGTANNDQLTIAGGTSFRNIGIVEARDSFLVIENMTLSPSNLSGNTLSEGVWIVDGANDEARISVQLPAGPTGVTNLDADLTLKGSQASFFVTPDGGGIRNLKDLLKKVDQGGVLRLVSHTAVFSDAAGGSSFDFDGLLELDGGHFATEESFLNVTGASPNTGVRGTGSIAAGALIINSGVISAEGGELEIKTAAAQTATGVTQALGVGDAIRLSGATISEGSVDVGAGAGLIGRGQVVDARISNAGLVGATGGALTLSLLGGLGETVNTGEITAQSNGELHLEAGSAGGTSFLNNAGGLISSISEGDGATSARVRLSEDVVVVGGDLLVRGSDAQLHGAGQLFEVDLRAELGGRIISDQGQTLDLNGDGRATALLGASTLEARFGSRLLIREYDSITAFGATFLANGSSSSVDLQSVQLTGGLLDGANGGRVRSTGDSTFTDVLNRGAFEVASGVLTLRETLDNTDGVATIKPSGRVELNDARILAGDVINEAGGSLVASGESELLGVQFQNFGTTTVNAGAILTVNQWEDPGAGLVQSGLFTNEGAVAVDGAMVVSNQEMINRGDVTVAAGASLDVQTYRQDTLSSATTTLHGTMTATDFFMEAGSLIGSGNLTGNLVHTGGTISPGSSPGTLTVGGAYELLAEEASLPELIMEIGSLTEFDRLVTLTGGMTLTGIITIDFLAEESITELITEAGDPVTFDLFDVPVGQTIDAEFAEFEFTGVLSAIDAMFNDETGELSFVALIPEPASLALLLFGAAAVGGRRNR